MITKGGAFEVKVAMPSLGDQKKIGAPKHLNTLERICHFARAYKRCDQKALSNWIELLKTVPIIFADEAYYQVPGLKSDDESKFPRAIPPFKEQWIEGEIKGKGKGKFRMAHHLVRCELDRLHYFEHLDNGGWWISHMDDPPDWLKPETANVADVERLAAMKSMFIKMFDLAESKPQAFGDGGVRGNGSMDEFWASMHDLKTEMVDGTPSGWKYACFVDTYIQFDAYIMPFAMTMFFVSANGDLCPWAMTFLKPSMGDSPKDFCTQMLLLTRLTLYCSLSMLNCKNVTIDDVPPRPRPMYARRSVRVPQFTYKVLRIDDRLVKKKRGAEKTPAGEPQRRFHICRGHFADYTEGRGLFGKYNGVFFVPDHVRGAVELGTVKKDYDLEKAEEITT